MELHRVVKCRAPKKVSINKLIKIVLGSMSSVMNKEGYCCWSQHSHDVKEVASFSSGRSLYWFDYNSWLGKNPKKSILSWISWRYIVPIKIISLFNQNWGSALSRHLRLIYSSLFKTKLCSWDCLLVISELRHVFFQFYNNKQTLLISW